MRATVERMRLDGPYAYFRVLLQGRRIGFLCVARHEPFRGRTIPYRYSEDDWGEIHYDQPVRASERLARNPREGADMVEQAYLRRHRQAMRKLARGVVRRRR